MQLFILGLRRSGTTAFWQTFRGDERFVAYNEPFNPLMRQIADPQSVAYPFYREFHELHLGDPERFWRSYRAIEGVEEIQEGLGDQQSEYLRLLIDSGIHTLFDLTRCHFKLASLAELAPDAVLVHLYRRAGSFATSHMVPSGSQIQPDALPRVAYLRLRNWLEKRRNRASFFRRSNRFDYWGIEQIIGSSPDSLFGRRLQEIGLDPQSVYAMPAVGRLLAYWRVHFERIEADGPRLFGERYLSVDFDEFCGDPNSVVERVYAALRSPAPALDLSRIHPPRGRFQPQHADWQRHASALGIPGSLL